MLKALTKILSELPFRPKVERSCGRCVGMQIKGPNLPVLALMLTLVSSVAAARLSREGSLECYSGPGGEAICLPPEEKASVPPPQPEVRAGGGKCQGSSDGTSATCDLGPEWQVQTSVPPPSNGESSSDTYSLKSPAPKVSVQPKAGPMPKARPSRAENPEAGFDALNAKSKSECSSRAGYTWNITSGCVPANQSKAAQETEADCRAKGGQWAAPANGAQGPPGCILPAAQKDAATESSQTADRIADEKVGESCISDWESAAAVCAPGRLAGMSGSENALMEGMVNQGVQVGTAMASQPKSGSSESMYETYKTVGTVTGTAGAVNVARGGSCMSLASSCSNSCEQAKTDVSNRLSAVYEDPYRVQALEARQALIRTKTSNCRGFESLGGQMLQAGVALGGQALQTLAAAKSIKAYDANLPTMANAIAPMPLPMVGAADPCANPDAAKVNPLCICRANPGDALCKGFGGGGAGAGATTATDGAPTGSPKNKYGGNSDDALALGMGPDAYTAGGAGGGPKGPSNNEIKQEGGGGPQAAPGGGGAGAGGAGGGFVPAVDDAGALGGFGRGGGGSGFSGYGRPIVEKSHDPSLAYAKLLASRHNIAGLLPDKNAYLNRLPAASMSLVRDGVTGPNDLSNWEKVSSQYQRQSPSMEP